MLWIGKRVRRMVGPPPSPPPPPLGGLEAVDSLLGLIRQGGMPRPETPLLHEVPTQPKPRPAPPPRVCPRGEN